MVSTWYLPGIYMVSTWYLMISYDDANNIFVGCAAWPASGCGCTSSPFGGGVAVYVWLEVTMIVNDSNKHR